MKERVIFILEAVDFEIREGFYFILEFFGANFSRTNAIKSEIFIRVFRGEVINEKGEDIGAEAITDEEVVSGFIDKFFVFGEEDLKTMVITI